MHTHARLIEILTPCIALLAICLAAGQHSAAKEGDPGHDLLAILREAYTASQDNCKQGRATGSFEKRATPIAGKPESTQLARCRLAWKPDKYKVVLEYSRNDNDNLCSEQIIIKQGDSIFRSFRSTGLKPIGSQGEIRPLQRIGNYPCGVPEFGYLEPSFLAASFAIIPRLLHDESKNAKLSRPAPDTILLTCQFQGIEYQVTARSRDRYNISDLKAYADNGAFLGAQIVLGWVRQNDNWYVKTIDYREDSKIGFQQHVCLKLDTIEANNDVPESEFGFSSLRLLPNARIFDNRIRDDGVEHR
jgi:hypothetical protein